MVSWGLHWCSEIGEAATDNQEQFADSEVQELQNRDTRLTVIVLWNWTWRQPWLRSLHHGSGLHQQSGSRHGEQ